MKGIDDPVKLQKEVLKRTYIISAIPVISAVVMGKYSSLLGFMLGLVISTLMFRLKFINIIRSIDMSEERATTFIRNRYFIEYFIYLVVLFVSARNPSLNFLAAAIGLFMLKFTVLAWAVIDLLRDELEKKVESYKN
ncbi:MAG: ATP synthase subunit I [Halanaerobiaceae bacterium]